MNAAEAVFIASAIHDGWTLRTGRKLGRTLYLHRPGDDWETDVCVGLVDSDVLAEAIANMWNERVLR